MAKNNKISTEHVQHVPDNEDLYLFIGQRQALRYASLRH